MAYTDPVRIYIYIREWCMALWQKLRSPTWDKGTNDDIQLQAAKRISPCLRVDQDPAMKLPILPNVTF